MCVVERSVLFYQIFSEIVIESTTFLPSLLFVLHHLSYLLSIFLLLGYHFSWFSWEISLIDLLKLKVVS